MPQCDGAQNLDILLLQRSTKISSKAARQQPFPTNFAHVNPQDLPSAFPQTFTRTLTKIVNPFPRMFPKLDGFEFQHIYPQNWITEGPKKNETFSQQPPSPSVPKI